MFNRIEQLQNEAFQNEPYSLGRKNKNEMLIRWLNIITKYHFENCIEYKNIINAIWNGSRVIEKIEDFPYLPVSIFKKLGLTSVNKDDIKITLTSSGTTGQDVSKIYLDSQTSGLQQKALVNSLGKFLGNKRLPMLVIDSGSVFKDPKLMSARGAGVLGLMRYGTDHHFAIDDQGNPNFDDVIKFLKKYKDRPFFMFGFTFMVWKEFFQKFKGTGLDLSNAVLIHSGGWKKMVEESVSPEIFKSALLEEFGLKNIYNFYGMVEQIGSLFFEGPDGLLYPPNFADVIIRDPISFDPLPTGETGLIQVVSMLPVSYPGHSLLTEDLGVVETIDPIKIGWKGKGLRVIGRVPKAELRGCSDVIAAEL
jgi:phenylacetate-coenzyme A ligase PaaK-like adenylate-forming protein